MAFCANCGATVNEGAGFCAGCGKPVGAATQATSVAQSGAAAQPAVAAPAQPGSSALTSNVAGALAYILGFITGIIFLVLDPYKNDRFVRFHAMQSIFFNVAYVIFWIAWSIVWGILDTVTGFWAFGIHAGLSLIIGLGIFVFWLYLMFQAYNNKEFKIPFIGPLAAKQAGV